MKNIRFKKTLLLILVILFIVIIRFLLSFKLASFYINNLIYDDKLMINNLNSLLYDEYLGEYSMFTLIKGIIYPFTLYFAKRIHLSYSVFYTLLYIGSCSFFVYSLKSIIKNKKILIVIFIILLFNPISYSSDLFQRLYRNSLSITELLLYLGIIIRIICDNKNKFYNYILLGLMISIMILTKEENIWIIFSLLIVFGYKLYKYHDIKNIIKLVIPIIVVVICLNYVSYINYKHYKIYTYNELSKSEFKKTFINIMKIKDDKKIEKVSIPKSTLELLAKNSKEFGITKKDIDKLYEDFKDEGKEIHNDKIIWYFRGFVYTKKNFKNGKEANEYFYKLNKDINKLYDKGVLKKEFAFSSIFLNTPTKKELFELPLNLIKTINYTSTYKDVKVLVDEKKINKSNYDYKVNSYKFSYDNYKDSANIQKKNPLGYEIIRVIYEIFTIIMSVVSIVIFIFNIKKKDILNLLIFIVLISYLIIICGVAYTHTTAFEAIRYCYLGNIYILQSLFILLNIVRLIDNKRGNIIRNEA